MLTCTVRVAFIALPPTGTPLGTAWSSLNPFGMLRLFSDFGWAVRRLALTATLQCFGENKNILDVCITYVRSLAVAHALSRIQYTARATLCRSLSLSLSRARARAHPYASTQAYTNTYCWMRVRSVAPTHPPPNTTFARRRQTLVGQGLK